MRVCPGSSYGRFVPSSLAANCHCIVVHICCDAGAISACHPTELLLASSVVNRKKHIVIISPFIQREYVSVNLPFGSCHLSAVSCLPLSSGLSSFLSVHQFKSVTPKASANVPASILSCSHPFIASSQFILSCSSALVSVFSSGRVPLRLCTLLSLLV